MGTLIIIIGLAVYVLLIIAVKNAIYRSFLKGTGTISGYSVLCFLTVFLIPAYILAMKKYANEIKAEAAELENIEIDPTEAQVDKYIEIVQKYGISTGILVYRQ